MLSIVSFLASYHSYCNLHQIMAPKDPVTTPALPGAEAHSAPVKNVSNSPIIPIASKEPAKDAFKEPEKEASKGGIDAKKSKTESKKKVSNAAKLDAVDVAMEVKVVEVVTVEAKVESSGVKEMPMPSSAKPSAGKEMPNESSAKKEMPMPSTAKSGAGKEMPNETSAKKDMPSSTKPSTGKEVLDEPSIKEMAMPSSAKPSAAKAMPNEPSVKKEMFMSSSAKPSEGKEMSNESSAKEMPEFSSAKPSASKEMSNAANANAVKVEVKVPDTPPVVSSLKKPAEVSAPSVQPHVEEDEVVILKETVSKKFGEMTFSDYNSVEDGDYSLSEAETEDSLEWASETERTRIEDDLTEDKVGIDYIGAALDIAAEQAASFRIVQAGLSISDWVLSTVESFITSSEVAPYLSSARRSARKIRRAGERESGPFRPLAMVSQSTMTMATAFLATPLTLLGWEFRPLTQAKAKKVCVVEDDLCEEPCTFEELDLSDYDSDMDADYSPSEESSSEDDLEFNTDAEESTGAEESDTE